MKKLFLTLFGSCCGCLGDNQQTTNINVVTSNNTVTPVVVKSESPKQKNNGVINNYLDKV